MHFAASTMFFHEYVLEEIFDYLAEAGADSVEFWMETPHFWLSGMPEEELSHCLAEHPGLIDFTFHAPILDLNPCSINPRVAEASVTYAEEAVAMAERMGAGVVTVHPGRRTAKRVPSAPDYERFESYIRRLAGAARGRKVRVAMENMEKKVNYLLSDPGAMRELLDQEPWLWFTLDISHAMGTSIAEVKRYIDLCGDRLANVHVGRAERGRMHLPMARRQDMGDLIRYIGRSGYEGNLTLEIEDLAFTHDLCSEEKVLLLSREVAFMRESLG